MAFQRTTGRPRNIGFPWSLPFLVLLFAAAGLSIPYGLMANPIQRRRARKFREHMRQQNRLLSWSEFAQKVEASQGTLIVEHRAGGSFGRWWWTPDDVYSVCPHPLGDWVSMKKRWAFREGAVWCQQRYTDPVRGTAQLVQATTREGLTIVSDDGGFRTGIRWIDIPPARERRNIEG